MRLGTTTTARLAVAGILAASLTACGSGSSNPTAQKSIKGCDVPTDRAPQGMVQEAVLDGFRAEHAVKDPQKVSQMESLYAHDRHYFDIGFDKFYGMVEDNPDITVRDMTMSTWEVFFLATEFPQQRDVYPAMCAGWTFEGYLQKHPNVDKAYAEAAIKSHKPTNLG